METLAALVPKIRELGDREAIRWIRGLRARTVTYSDLWGRIGAGVVYLKEKGAIKGDRILIWAENRPEWVAIFWACIASGIHVVPVDARFSPELAARIRTDSGARLIVDGAVMDELGSLQPRQDFPITEVAPDDIVEIVYTSGTTGEPKGIVHRHRNICANLTPFQKEIEKYRRRAALFQPIRILDLLPLSHMFGQSQGIFIPLFLGGAVAFTDELNPEAITRIVRTNRITVIVCVPRMLEMLGARGWEMGTEAGSVPNRAYPPVRDWGRSPPPSPFPIRPQALSLLRRIWRYRAIHSRFGWKFWAFVVGGARVEPRLEEFWTERGFAVIQGYGLTEASPVVAVNHPFSSKRGSLGKPVPGQEVKLGEDGEILVRGASVAGVVDQDGWLHTGDLGEMDNDGRLYYRGRKKDLVVTPEGLNVFPDDVESVLNQLPGIRQSAVVSVNDHVHAALILSSKTVDAADIIHRANQRLESHQRIRTWSVWPEVDFPRTPSTMKIRRGEVASRIQAGDTPTPEQLPDPQNMSSLERVELLSELEERQGIEIDEEAFSKINTAAELQELLARPGAPAKPESRASAWPTWLPVRWFRNVFQLIFPIPLFRNRLSLTVEGMENLAGLEGPVLFAANHASDLDTPAIFAALPFHWWSRVAPAMRGEYFRGHFFQYVLSRLVYNGYLLPQELAGVRKGLTTTADLVARGYSPLIYPEGRRTSNGKLQEFRPGIGMMAVRLQLPVVPIHLEGLFEIYSINDSWPRRGPVRVVIGAPLRFSSNVSYSEATRAIRHAIEEAPKTA